MQRAMIVGAWCGLMVFLAGGVVFSLGTARGWFGSQVRDDCTFEQFVTHLDKRGVRVVIEDETRRTSLLHDRATNGWVEVTRFSTPELAREEARLEGRRWYAHCVVGPFLIVVGHNSDSSVDLCRRIAQAYRE